MTNPRPVTATADPISATTTTRTRTGARARVDGNGATVDLGATGVTTVGQGAMVVPRDGAEAVGAEDAGVGPLGATYARPSCAFWPKSPCTATS